jgi:uncharacterized membrane protein YoaK (UPF0700 family)
VSVSEPNRTQPALLWALTALTVVSGLNDAVSYLGLGRVFTANMTGNVVVLGFATAGAPGFSVAATLTSLALFLVGAGAAGLMAKGFTSRRTLFLLALGIEAVFTAAAATVAGLGPHIGSGWQRYTMITLLAFAMGIRNSVVRRLAVPDVTTTVLTMTLTGLATDSFFDHRTHPHTGRRIGAVVAMFGGAVVGAILLRHVDATWPLAISSGIVALAAVVMWRRPAAEIDQPTPGTDHPQTGRPSSR